MVAGSPLPAYVVVSPVKDEVEHLGRTAASLAAQDHLPHQWVIVDDGSTDGTFELATGLAEQHDWVRLVPTGRTGERARGGPIVRAFNAGRAAADLDGVEFIVKLDGDIHVPAHYFAWVAAVFARTPRAGIVGGLVLVHDGTEWRPDATSRRSVHGAAKAYRLACLDAIGGLPDSMGWDGLDEYAARARGWEVHVLTELAILHYRRRGSKQHWRQARWEEGVGTAFMGYRPSAMLLRAGYRMIVERPPVIGGLTLAAGYVVSRLRRAPQFADADARRQLRSEQSARWRRLARGTRYLDPAGLPDGGPAFWEVGTRRGSDDRAGTRA